MCYPLGTLYHGSKWAVEGLSEALHFELIPLGIRVKIVEPGGVATDFGGRSFVFTNDESMTEYQETVQKLFAGFGDSLGSPAPASMVAEVIWQAATDDTPRLRYIAGKDAEKLITQRKAVDDATFLGGMKAQFKL